MKKNVITISAIAILIIIGAYILMNQGGILSLGGARTYYESLDLSSPKAAVKTFTDAFAREDYPTVFFILSMRAQGMFRSRFSTLEYQYVFDIESSEAIMNEVAFYSKGPEYFEHNSLWYLFDEVMLAAKKYDALLIDLSGDVVILGTEPSETRWEETIDVLTEVEGIDGVVRFRMVLSPGGRWRVMQVIVPGGNENLFPWAVPIPWEFPNFED